MRHFVCFPTADPKRGVPCAWKWMEKGYDPFFMLDRDVFVSDTLFSGTVPCLWEMHCEEAAFPGYYRVINRIASEAFKYGADLVTAVGDDMDPPPQGAQAVAEMYFARFPDGYGVMQATGDKQGDLAYVPGYEHLGKLHNAARICGSPTFGRGWYERSPYGPGKPFHDGFKSFYADEHLWNVAMRAGVLWLNPEVTIFHRHWSWHGGKQPYHERAQRHWEEDRRLFFALKAHGFPAGTKEFPTEARA